MTTAASRILIRPIRTEDLSGLHAAFSAVADERRWLLSTRAPDLERLQAFVERSIAQDFAHHVALDGERLIGWADICPSGRPNMQHVGSLGMGLLPEYRGQGIGTRLLQATLDKAWSKGLTRLELEVMSDNHPAIRLYERLGYRTEGTRRQACRIDGAYRDILIMAQLRD